MKRCALCGEKKPKNPVSKGWKIFDITETTERGSTRHVLSFCPAHSREEIWQKVLDKVPPVDG